MLSMLPREIGKTTGPGERRAIFGFPFTYKPSLSGVKRGANVAPTSFNPETFFRWIHGPSTLAPNRKVEMNPDDLPHVFPGSMIWQTVCLNAISYRDPDLRSACRRGDIKVLYFLGFTGDFFASRGPGIYRGSNPPEEEEFDGVAF